MILLLDQHNFVLNIFPTVTLSLLLNQDNFEFNIFPNFEFAAEPR